MFQFICAFLLRTPTYRDYFVLNCSEVRLKGIVKMFNDLNNIGNLQATVMGFNSYKNEFETMWLVMKTPQAETSAQIAWNSAKSFEKNNTSLRLSESISLREQGNKLFKTSPEHALDACRFFTKSILIAPLGSEALALAHANRAIALQTFGYFQQAYDDCECALEQGYPINLRHKIIARQATCAEKLGDAALLQKHLDALTTLSLNKSYRTQVEELEQSLEKMKLEENKLENNNEQNTKEYRGPLKIIKTKSKGRCLVAEKPIRKDELVFAERAFSFVPLGERHVCQYCAATQIIAFPCYRCNGKVAYCSLKCRVAHQEIHGYECKAYQNCFFHNQCDHLALRMVLDGIQEILPFLEQKRTSKEIWNELTCEKSTLMQSNIEYVHSLRMLTHLEKKSLSDIIQLANTAFLMSWYLRNQTNFFDLFKRTNASVKDWQLVIASLILRHMGQLRTNGNTLAVLTIKVKDPFDSTLLVTKLWQSPFHVRRGLLHMFCSYEDVLVANFPYFSLFNHACTKSILTKRNGRYLSAYAVCNIDAGKEILNSYNMDFGNLRRIEHQKYLMEAFHFECKCEKCTKDNPDEDYENFHRFVCEHSNCRQIFVSDVSLNEILNFRGEIKLHCGKCHAFQYGVVQAVEVLSYAFHKNITKETVKNMVHEPLLTVWMNAFKGLDEWLPDPHYLKFELSIKLVEQCFAVFNTVGPTKFPDIFSQIIDILKYHLRYLIERGHLKTVDYCGPMTYLWDSIALGKYQCDADEMQEMLQAIEILPDETRKLFMNYYNDYIIEHVIS